MPVVIPSDDFDCWLDPDETKFKEACALLKPAPDDFIEAYEVSPRVNKVVNDDAENIVSVDGANSRAATPIILAYTAFAYWVFHGKTPAEGWY